MHVGYPKNFGDAGTSPPWHGVWLIPRNTLLRHMCYCTKFGRSRSNLVGIGRGRKKFLGDAGTSPS